MVAGDQNGNITYLCVTVSMSGQPTNIGGAKAFQYRVDFRHLESGNQAPVRSTNADGIVQISFNPAVWRISGAQSLMIIQTPMGPFDVPMTEKFPKWGFPDVP